MRIAEFRYCGLVYFYGKREKTCPRGMTGRNVLHGGHQLDEEVSDGEGAVLNQSLR